MNKSAHSNKIKGFIHVYTGNGKGKTTAALGLALRAAGAGKRVFIGQFVKGMKYAEFESLVRLDDLITIEQFGRDCFIYHEPEPEDIRLARQGLERCRFVLNQGEYELVVLDEIFIALHFNLFSLTSLLQLLQCLKPDYDLVLTGRYAPAEVVKMAHIVTEMKEISHYYRNGIQARLGIDK